jgi:hypothetical protein
MRLSIALKTTALCVPLLSATIPLVAKADITSSVCIALWPAMPELTAMGWPVGYMAGPAEAAYLQTAMTAMSAGKVPWTTAGALAANEAACAVSTTAKTVASSVCSNITSVASSTVTYLTAFLQCPGMPCNPTSLGNSEAPYQPLSTYCPPTSKPPAPAPAPAPTPPMGG